MISKKNRLRVRKVHKLTGLLLGIQLSFWIISGIYFSWIPLDTVRGRDMANEKEVPDLQIGKTIPIKKVKGIDKLTIQEVRLVMSPSSQLVYRVRTGTEWVSFDAESGERLPVLSEVEISEIAKRDYRENAIVKSIQLVKEQAPQEFKGSLPVYLVEMDDFRGTNLYFDPTSGEILARRNHYWRVFDFLWMLHILDFGERENFNNSLLRAFSLFSILIVVSGYGIYFSLKLKNSTFKNQKANQ